MPKKNLLPTSEPQQNAISLEQAVIYVHHWHEFIKELYEGQDQHMPHGFFIPFTDINELVNLQKTVTHLPGEEQRIYIVGVRAYYCLKNKVSITHPVSASDYPVEGLLVAVYQTNFREPHTPGEYEYDPAFPTFDLVMPVPSVKDINEPGDGDDYSIYDITQPCPNLCDASSPLY